MASRLPEPEINFRQQTSTSSTMLKRILIVIACICSAAFAADTQPSEASVKAQPSEASIKELLRVMDAHKLLDSITSQMDGYMQSFMAQASQGQTITPEQQKIMDKMRAKTVAIMKEELNWEQFEPLYLRVYTQSFSQEEVDGMIAFYASPIGKSVMNKMPLVMKNAMTEMQGRMKPIMMKMQGVQQEMMQEMQAEKAKAQPSVPAQAPTPTSAQAPALVPAPTPVPAK
ncbi:MAG: DUF2059 domain-containing protein [Opitutaceae bacterium]|jgi:hypothetical protein